MYCCTQQQGLLLTLQQQVSARDSHLSSLSRSWVFFILLSTTTSSQCIFFSKILTSYIPLCFVFVSFNVLCIVFVLIALLFTNNQTELCHALGMTRLLVQFLAKSEGLVFPLPYPEAGGDFWYFEHSKRRSNPETQFCTQGLGSGQKHSLLKNSEQKHFLLA